MTFREKALCAAMVVGGIIFGFGNPVQAVEIPYDPQCTIANQRIVQIPNQNFPFLNIQSGAQNDTMAQIRNVVTESTHTMPPGSNVCIISLDSQAKIDSHLQGVNYCFQSVNQQNAINAVIVDPVFADTDPACN
ncbi:hypothetical protein [Nisaea sp.]|uniref:hypothetical protein n=1 Tax=Nisaea sp. TaxID=2024842 RepID=UPI00329A0DB0